jgi:hypothetical protein
MESSSRGKRSSMYKTALLALVASFSLASTALGEKKQDAGATTGNANLCKSLYEIYDLNMEAYYTKGQTNRDKQASYNAAQSALSDFRKQGCKVKDIK